MNRNRLLTIAAAGCLAGAMAFVSCRKEPPALSWLDALHAEGRSLFFAAVRDELAGHPLKSSLTEGEIAKISEAETRYERLYEILVNVFYQKDEPLFSALIEKGDKEARGRFAEMYRVTVKSAARHFVEAFFATDAATELIRKSIEKYRELDAVDLVVRSVGYEAKLDIPPVPAASKPLSPEFAGQGALEGGGFRAAHQVTRGNGAKIAILDTGIDTTHPVFQHTEWGPHFSLIGPAGPPWDARTPVVDWGSHGTLISSVAAVFAPEARLTMYKFGATLDIPYLRDACQYAYDRNRVVISGGLYMRWYEKGNTRNFPAQYQTVVSVTAAEKRKDGTYGYWNVCAPDPTVTLAAPNDIFGAFPVYIDREDTYIPSISAAIPVVASLFALAVSEYPPTGKEAPGAYAQALIDLVVQSADPGKVGYQGFTPECGHGLIDAEKTVKQAGTLRENREAEEKEVGR
ncbi:MAG: peptidase [Candidatus Aminicenantes bacterium]|nr:peptidase [Candidatus Aminicenantes bacterium]